MEKGEERRFIRIVGFFPTRHTETPSTVVLDPSGPKVIPTFCREVEEFGRYSAGYRVAVVSPPMSERQNANCRKGGRVGRGTYFPVSLPEVWRFY
jgi:hypothetical protein